jgi:hypothetical protein
LRRCSGELDAVMPRPAAALSLIRCTWVQQSSAVRRITSPDFVGMVGGAASGQHARPFRALTRKDTAICRQTIKKAG